MDVSADLRACIAETFGEPVTLPSGATVMAVPGVATSDDALNGDTVIAGRTRTLRFVSADVPDLAQGSTLTWAGKTWRVNQIQLAAMGYATRAFLGAP